MISFVATHRRLLALVLSISTSALSPALAQAQEQNESPPEDAGWFDEASPPAEAPAPATQSAAPKPQPSPAPAPQPVEASPDTDPSAITEFRPTLDRYGYWVEDPKYGLVWVPYRDHVGPNFAPYVTSGHWALADDGDWMWVSDYPFGWVVFHYGRWVWVPGTGWAWIPGRQYAHAWVTWRVPTGSYAYLGWAPMPPSYVWFGGVAVGVWYRPPVAYVFCPSHYVFSYRVHHHIVRDRYVIHRAATHTRHYVPYHQHTPAAPRTRGPVGTRSASAPPRTPSAPSSATIARPKPGSHGIANPRGPSLEAARVPASAVPRQRTAPNARAMEVARRTPSVAPRPANMPAAIQRPGQKQAGPAARPGAPARPAPQAQASGAPRPVPAKKAPAARAPAAQAPAARAPAPRAPAAQAPAARAPAARAPAARAPAARAPAPRVSTPRASAPRAGNVRIPSRSSAPRIHFPKRGR